MPVMNSPVVNSSILNADGTLMVPGTAPGFYFKERLEFGSE
jgi:hypothetical protein